MATGIGRGTRRAERQSGGRTRYASMNESASYKSGRHFLQIPGPTPVPDRILRAMARPVIDHRGPEFAALGREVLAGIRPIFGTDGPVIIYPSSGSGAWEAALVNTMSPGDRVLMCETGHFARLWAGIAERLGLEPSVIDTDWRHPADPAVIEAALREDKAHGIKAVCIVHNETATGVVSDIAAIRRAMDAAYESADLHLHRFERAAGLTPGIADGRHDIVAGVDRLSPG